jgi:hypothetical protein
VGKGTTFPEWDRARQGARPEDESQKRLVELLQQPIAASETKRLATRKSALQDLADRMPQVTAARMHERLESPTDPLGQFTTFELSTALRDELLKRLGVRQKAGSRGTDQQQRGTQPPPVSQKVQEQRSTSPPSSGFGGPRSFLFGPPLVIQLRDISSPQYYPTGFPPLGIFLRPVLRVPLVFLNIPPQKKPPSPPVRRKKPPVATDDRNDSEEDRKDLQKDRKQRLIVPGKRQPSIIDWLSDQLTHSSSAAMIISGLLLTLPADAVAAALAAATKVFAEGGTVGRAGEEAAKEMLQWTLKKNGLARHIFDLNDISKRFPGLDLIDEVRPRQIRMWGINTKGPKYKVARDIAGAIVKMFDDRYGNSLPAATTKALKAASGDISLSDAWPASWPAKPTDEEWKVLLRETCVGVPDDLVFLVRGALAERLLANPKERELYPEISLGSLIKVKGALAGGAGGVGRQNGPIYHDPRHGGRSDDRTVADDGRGGQRASIVRVGVNKAHTRRRFYFTMFRASGHRPSRSLVF